eukprot:CAMPEP_0169280194 /NCGR_PEP_ID=MMETSP1016-20121227/55461_1 /TAXON_ID=342587 /ORGANISM="Karlodinium micrum, Strain CCMP2283" /LENGTH=98 /DNA_ID=CAMNT_0009368471 /DNA_START=390 /DNA_END=686 /DNA_ORIENTATION=-
MFRFMKSLALPSMLFSDSDDGAEAPCCSSKPGIPATRPAMPIIFAMPIIAGKVIVLSSPRRLLGGGRPPGGKIVGVGAPVAAASAKAFFTISMCADWA